MARVLVIVIRQDPLSRGLDRFRVLRLNFDALALILGSLLYEMMTQFDECFKLNLEFLREITISLLLEFEDYWFFWFMDYTRLSSGICCKFIR